MRSINNGQVYALAALYAKKFTHGIEEKTSFQDFCTHNLEPGYYISVSMAGTGAEIAREIVNQFGTDGQLAEFITLNEML